ncbi:TIGR02301 family protein [Hoeflea phototrophica DFL-43]|jgi:uncharacterized protein (TIGR02301 family)|uniref:TIGR02301 family protein n=1 Tax=Hoeflea phototrophica (strain DSM 17068 / NCIMB 14078 / DFL-43) TaxID=411684 RepID=A9DBB7_HOEPD|nr:TIGR02301 family protein [Hoeflea phototrophica]EDQ32480.1 TIGR02301 family protein [Hoeflea phototrophica DFL-43]
MLRSLFVILGLVLSVPLIGGGATAHAQTTEDNAPVATYTEPPPYQDRLLRLAEILGSVQYLRDLCNGESETSWRDSMQALIDSETAGEPQRRESLTAGYNRGFRAFASVYASCTDAARVAEARYRREGATLVSEIVARYGN